MIVTKTLPTSPFCSFSFKVYQHPVVEENLIALQNERGLNVNVLLFCVWYALTDQGRLTRSELKKIVMSIQTWHEGIVLPLRRLRKKLKSNPSSLAAEIRRAILNEEIFSEKIEQLIMVDNYVHKTRPIRNNLQKIIDTCKNIFAYCHLLSVFLDIEDAKKVSQILVTIFSKIDRDLILRYCIENLIEKDLQSVNLTAQFPLDL